MIHFVDAHRGGIPTGCHHGRYYGTSLALSQITKGMLLASLILQILAYTVGPDLVWVAQVKWPEYARYLQIGFVGALMFAALLAVGKLDQKQQRRWDKADVSPADAEALQQLLADAEAAGLILPRLPNQAPLTNAQLQSWTEHAQRYFRVHAFLRGLGL